eukprot:4209397-Heterocapsa_arctica.AAC.1
MSSNLCRQAAVWFVPPTPTPRTASHFGQFVVNPCLMRSVCWMRKPRVTRAGGAASCSPAGTT